MNEIVSFLKTEHYLNLISNICEEYHLKLADFQEEESDFYERILNKKLNNAQVSFNEIKEFLKEESERIKEFSILNINFFDKDEEQEYPKGEEIEKEDSISTSLGYSYDFIFSFAISYYILKTKPDYFEEYSKKMRIPYAKKYAKQVKKLYKQIEK